MNQDTDTTSYVATLKDLTLSDSARSRIQKNLTAYAAFHAVRSDELDRSIEVGTKPTFLFPLRFSYMPFVILIAVLIGGGTSLAAEGSVPGDFLYPIKIGVNENVRSALAIGADSEAELQTFLLAERVEEAETLQAEGRLNGEMAETVASNITVQSKLAVAASADSSAVVATETQAKIKSSLQTVLAIATLNVDSGSVASTRATKMYEIGAFKVAMNVRITALTEVLQKYQSRIDGKVYTSLTSKIESASKLRIEAENQSEAEARVTLERAATLAGEVESTLSTLGQVTVDTTNGTITDIDFSIDPMIIDRGEGSNSNGVPSDPRAAQSGGGAEVEMQSSGSVDSGVIDISVDGSASVSGDAVLGR